MNPRSLTVNCGESQSPATKPTSGSEHGPVGLHVGLATVEERARGLGSERPVPLRVVGDEVGSRDVRVTAGQRQRRAHADRIHRRGEDPHQ